MVDWEADDTPALGYARFLEAFVHERLPDSCSVLWAQSTGPLLTVL